MRVAMVSPFPPPGVAPSGGLEIASLRVARALREAGVDTTIVGLGSADESIGGVPVIGIRGNERWSVLRDLRPLRRELSQALGTLEPQVVHAQDLMPAGYASVREAGGRPTVITLHGNRRQDTMGAYRGLSAHARWRLARPMTRRAATEATAIVGVHPDWQIGLAWKPSRYVHIPNIVEEAFFAARRAPERAHVLYCGGPRRIKGWDVLLAAWPIVLSRIPEARLKAPGCVGTLGALRSDVAASIEAGPLLGSDELATAMACAEIVVLPSRFEVAPIAMAEAFAARTPVVAAAVGGIPALATGAARLVAAPDPVAIAEAIVDVILHGHDPDLVEEASRRADRHRAVEVARAHTALYESVLAA